MRMFFLFKHIYKDNIVKKQRKFGDQIFNSMGKFFVFVQRRKSLIF